MKVNSGAAGFPSISFSLAAENNIGGATTTYSSDVEMNANLAAAQNIQLTFSSPIVVGNGFQSMAFDITKNGVNVLNEDFTTVAAAENFFLTNSTLNLGTAQAGDLDLAVAMTLTDDPAGDGFDINGLATEAVATPEPSTWAMLILSGLTLGWRVRKARAKA